MLEIFTRKNFPEKIKLKIIKKASRCQICGLQTDCGECAHIVASGKNGPRNKHQLVLGGMIPENYDTNDEENGLYLCANCHTLIDQHPDKYSYRYLTQIKNNEINVVKNSSSAETKCDDFVQLEQPSIHHEEITHVDKEQYYGLICTKCSNCFKSKQALLYHVRHNVCRNKFVCDRCNVPFSSKQKLNYHQTRNVCIMRDKMKLALKSNEDYTLLSKEELIQKLVNYECKNTKC